MQACDHHLKAVREWSTIEDVGGMRRFLGNFNWVRQHFPTEYILCLPALTNQVKKNAVWPMPEKALKAMKALQKLAERAMQLYPLDVCAAITGERPINTVADCSGFGWGSSDWQLSADKTKLCVLSQFAGLLSEAQSRWQPRKGELYAQHQGSRARRKQHGRIPATHWTDHSHLMCDLTSPLADPAVIRWIADIVSDGSTLKNLGAGGQQC